VEEIESFEIIKGKRKETKCNSPWLDYRSRSVYLWAQALRIAWPVWYGDVCSAV